MELLVIIVLALIVFGPGKLPEMMGQIGRAWRDFQRVTTDLSSEFNKTLQVEIEETKAAAEGRKPTTQAAPTPEPTLLPAPPVTVPATNGAAHVPTATGDASKPSTGGDPAPSA